jgi:hypothetical protein
MAQITRETLVKLDVPLGDETIRLSTLDQQAQRNYAKLLLVFKQANDTDTAKFIKHLEYGLAKALTEIPDFASTVVPRPGSQRKELDLRLGPESGVSLRVVCQGHTFEIPQDDAGSPQHQAMTYADLSKAGFPIAEMPIQTLFQPEEDCEDACPDGIPATRIQVNTIEGGGIILALGWHHTVSDARGVTNLFRSWSRHTKMSMSHEPSSDAPLAFTEHSQERWRLEIGTESAQLSQFPDYISCPTLRTPLREDTAHLLDRPDPTAAGAVFSTWHFSSAYLKSLRSHLSDSAVEDSSSFTQSEAVSALIWKHLSIARGLHLDAPPDATSLFSTRIDFRARTKPPFSEDFVGNINEPNATTRLSLEEVCAPSTPDSLATLAHAIRNAVGSLDEDDMRAFIGVVDGLPAVTDLTWRYNTYPGPDLAFTDMSGTDILRQDWGGDIGYPRCLRTASREKGVVYVLPQDQDGGFEVQLQSEPEAVERLKEDTTFTRYAQFVC